MFDKPLNIKVAYPPNIDKIKARFNLEGKKPVFCYGDTLYNPHSGTIGFDLLIHEATHSRRQGKEVEAWWDKYLEDDDFRRMEELEAYSYQYKFYCEMNKDPNQRHKFLHRICVELSGEMYGNIITYNEAMKVLRSATKEFIK